MLVGLCAITAMMFVATRPKDMIGPKRVTAPAGAQLTRTVPGISALDSSELRVGDVITTAKNETATIRYAGEPTLILIQPGSMVEFKGSADGKRLELRRGALTASVAPQTNGHPMLITTPHARATVVGTEFALRVDEATTKLDVLEGKVLFTCRFNAKKVMVAGGFSSISDQGGPVAVVPIQPPTKR